MKLLVILALCAAWPSVKAGAEQRTVVRVIDGDTVVLAAAEGQAQDETLRLIGIDAPELAGTRGRGAPGGFRRADCFALRAAGELAKLADGKPVLVERDPQAAATDRYGRTLGYLYLADSGKLLNGEMVRRGFARAYLRFPFRYSDLFKTYEAAAKQQRAGLWGKC